MSLTTLFWYLVGDATAIEQVATNPWSGVLGFVFVLSTGLARHYDTHDLRAQPWRVFVPLVVSLLLALLLSGSLYLLTWTKTGAWFPLGSGCWSLVGLFWMTAPLAWLYAIPYQRLLSSGQAVRAKLATLGLLAMWRVLLLGRAVSLLFPDSWWAGYAIVLLIADIVALGALAITRPAEAPSSTPRLILGMAAIGPAETVPDSAGLTCLLQFLGIITLPVWFGIALNADPAPGTWLWHGLNTSAAFPAPSLWLLGGMMLLIFASIVRWSQPAQQLRTSIERLFQQGKLAKALEELSQRNPGAFPPHWQPPPLRDFREPPRLLDVMALLTNVPVANWVRSLYLERFRQFLSDPYWYWFYDVVLEQIAEILRQMPEGPELARLIREKVREHEGRLDDLYGFVHNSPSERNSEVDELISHVLQPPPSPTGRRVATIAALWQLADDKAPR